jgi:hypothetical protein
VDPGEPTPRNPLLQQRLEGRPHPPPAPDHADVAGEGGAAQEASQTVEIVTVGTGDQHDEVGGARPGLPEGVRKVGPSHVGVGEPVVVREGLAIIEDHHREPEERGHAGQRHRDVTGAYDEKPGRRSVDFGIERGASLGLQRPDLVVRPEERRSQLPGRGVQVRVAQCAPDRAIFSHQHPEPTAPGVRPSHDGEGGRAPPDGEDRPRRIAKAYLLSRHGPSPTCRW